MPMGQSAALSRPAAQSAGACIRYQERSYQQFDLLTPRPRDRGASGGSVLVQDLQGQPQLTAGAGRVKAPPEQLLHGAHPMPQGVSVHTEGR